MISINLRNGLESYCKDTVSFLYTGVITLTDEDIGGTVQTNALQVKSLSNICATYFRTKLTINNSLKYYTICENSHLSTEADEILSFICMHFDELSDTELF